MKALRTSLLVALTVALVFLSWWCFVHLLSVINPPYIELEDGTRGYVMNTQNQLIGFLLAIGSLALFMTLRSNLSKKKVNTKDIKKGDRDEKASAHELAFSEQVLEVFEPTMEQFSFQRKQIEVKKYGSTILWRKDKQYIKVNSSTYPTDYPYCFNLILGEGDSEIFLEYDWNSVALWALAKEKESKSSLGSYDFPYGKDIEPRLKKALEDLIEHGSEFLNGDLTLFYEARKSVNEKRTPYQIHKMTKDGDFQTRDEETSKNQRSKYT